MTEPSSERLHATCVAIGSQAVLLTGASGAGKSDLALRLIDRGAALIADDYTLVTRRGDRAIASAPATIHGKIEVRGIGIVAVDPLDEAEVHLMILLDQPPLRFPEPIERLVAGVAITAVALSPFEASAPIKVELALKALTS